MSVCLYPGSFDPPTLGHLDLIARASALFEEVIVAIMVNPDKRPAFTSQQRADMLRRVCQPYGNVRVIVGEGLTAEQAGRSGADVLLRGCRAGDFAVEAQLAAANRQLTGIDTLCLFTAPQYDYVSSSLVRDVARHGGDISAMAPAAILDDIQKGLRGEGRSA